MLDEAATKRRRTEEGPGKSAACLRMREKILAVERDYTHYFALDVGGEAGADQYVYQHFNTLCMVGIAPSSIVFAGGRKVTQVDFDVGRGGDKSDAPKPSGKKKKGAMYVNRNQRCCTTLPAPKRLTGFTLPSPCAPGAASYPNRLGCATLFATTEHA